MERGAIIISAKCLCKGYKLGETLKNFLLVLTSELVQCVAEKEDKFLSDLSFYVGCLVYRFVAILSNIVDTIRERSEDLNTSRLLFYFIYRVFMKCTEKL